MLQATCIDDITSGLCVFLRNGVSLGHLSV